LGAPQAGTAQSTSIQRRKTPSILQGATDETRTQFSVVYNVQVELNIYALDAQGVRYNSEKIVPLVFKGQPLKVTKAYFSGLPADQKFQLIVEDARSGQKLDQREFKMLHSNPSRALKFSLASCMNDENHSPEIWRTMVAQNPDVIFFIGDSVYADTGAPSTGADPEHLWQRFCEARTTLEIYYSKKLIPIIATWDDHDFGLNDSNAKEYPYVEQSQRNFLNFFAQNPAYCRFLAQGPGVASALKLNGQLFLLMDDRSFRDVSGSKDRYAHWGQTQERWALNLMDTHSGPTWLMNGSQVYPAMPFKESLSQNHPIQFEGFKEEIRQRSSKVVFVSGDVHFSEVSKIEKESLGYPTYELTSSSIHSLNMPGAPHVIPNKRRIAGAGARNYIMVESKAKKHGTTFVASCVGADGDNKFQLKLEV
jgi:phosphodiesterase/alkaline phosphatase D-like protein